MFCVMRENPPHRLLILLVVIGSCLPASAQIRGKPISIPTRTNTAAVSTVAVTNLNANPPRTTKTGDYAEVGFDRLSNYAFEIPDGLQTNSSGAATKSSAQIPAEVKAFDQKKVALKGFMLPLKVADGVVTELLLMKDQSMCCYGAVPRINDWVSVKMKKGGVKSIMDQPVTIYGKLHVGEMLENGYLVGIYELDGDKMDEPKE